MPNGPTEIDPDQFGSRPPRVFNLAPKSASVCTLPGGAALADRLRAGALWLKDPLCAMAACRRAQVFSPYRQLVDLGQDTSRPRWAYDAMPADSSRTQSGTPMTGRVAVCLV